MKAGGVVSAPKRPGKIFEKSVNWTAPLPGGSGHSAGVTAPASKVFGMNVNRLRVLRDLTQEDLAGRTGIDRRYVQRIEKGEANPGIERISALYDALEAPWDDLMRGLPIRPGNSIVSELIPPVRR